jgi:hypothetical protein
LGLQSAPVASRTDPVVPQPTFVDTYCATCHNQRLKTGGLVLESVDMTDVGSHAPEWEKVVIKLRAGADASLRDEAAGAVRDR